MITREIIEMHRDVYEKGLTVQEYVDFFKDTIKHFKWYVDEPRTSQERKYREIWEEVEQLTDEELAELAEAIIELNEEDEEVE